jgi:hypothetical protein
LRSVHDPTGRLLAVVVGEHLDLPTLA